MGIGALLAGTLPIDGACAAAEGSIILRPGDDVAAIVAAAPRGSVFLFPPGLYRGVSITPKDGDRFIGLQHGAVLSGARVVGGFIADGSRWRAPFDAAPADLTARCLPDRACDRPEEVFIDGVAQRPVTSAAAVTGGTFFVDTRAGQLLLGSDPTGKAVEVSAIRHAFAGTAEYVHVGGLVIEKYATPAHEGAVGGAGPRHWTIEDCEARFNHGAGIAVGDFSRAIHNAAHENGEAGIVASGLYVVVERNEIAGNNSAGFDAAQAGGVLLADTLHAVLRDNIVHGNHGAGLRIAAGDATLYEGNRIAENDGPGILDAGSRAATVHDNELRANGGSVSGAAQLSLIDAAGFDVYGNRLTVPDGGLGIEVALHGPRSPTDMRDDFVHDNDIALAGAAGAAVALQAGGADEAALARSLHLDRNRYHAPTPDGRYWRWLGADRALTFDELRAETGEEHDGAIDYVPAAEPPQR
jgi:hypothetical protein